MKTFICTCGTSIISKSGINIDRFKNRPLSDSKNFESDIETVRECVFEKLLKLKLPDDINDTSAEIKSLMKMGIKYDDRVILISTDTIDGKLCAELVRDFLHEKRILNINQIEIKVISGLQALDGCKFEKEGLKNLLSYLINLEYENIVLNPTGGYKSVVPYISLIGMLFNKPIQYVHEDSQDVITLTNIPIKLDENLLFKIEDKLRKIENETAISIDEWKKDLDFYDRRFDCFIEIHGNEVTLSGIGILFWERFKQDFPKDLVRDNTPPNVKSNKLRNLGISHHGINRILSISNRLVESPYVKSVINSCENMPFSKEWIKPLKKEETTKHIQRESENICIVTDINSDAGYSFLIETTARNFEENERIAKILKKQFFGI